MMANSSPGAWEGDRPGPNFVPLPYRRVSYQRADFPLTPSGLQTVIGRDAYRHTDYIIYYKDSAIAIAAVEKESRKPLFSPIVRAEWLSPPERTRLVTDHDVDTGIPSSLADKAGQLGVSPEEALVVVGRYEHVNFVYRPDPVTVCVVEVAPPEPPKLFDLAQRVLAVAPLAATRLVLERIDLRDLARDPGPDGFLLPCRSSGMDALGVSVRFLDERPDRADWVLVGCERSRQIHEHIYGDRPPCRELCPRKLIGRREQPTLAKCCMLESGFERDGQVVVVPWGADFADVEAGLRELVGSA